MADDQLVCHQINTSTLGKASPSWSSVFQISTRSWGLRQKYMVCVNEPLEMGRCNSGAPLDRLAPTIVQDSIHNRYTTPRWDVPNAQHITFSTSVDPKGILEGMIDSDHVHTEENTVLYFSSHVDRAGKRSWVVGRYGATYAYSLAALNLHHCRYSARRHRRNPSLFRGGTTEGRTIQNGYDYALYHIVRWDVWSGIAEKFEI